MKHLPLLLTWDEELSERYELVMYRIAEIRREEEGKKAKKGRPTYCYEVSGQLLLMNSLLELVRSGEQKKLEISELRTQNEQLYYPKSTEGYADSYLNPQMAAEAYGAFAGAALSAIYSEVMGLIPSLFKGEARQFLYVCELFAEISNYFGEHHLGRNVRQSLFYYAHDYCGELLEKRLFETRCTEACGYYYDLIVGAPLTEAMLYGYGEPITDNERRVFAFLAELPEVEIEAMADTFVNGYVNGFTTMGLDISRKETVEVRCRIGFERITRMAIEKLEALGKKPLLYLHSHTLMHRSFGRSVGISGSSLNLQCEYDHRNDGLLFLNRRYLDVHLKGLRHAYENVAEECKVYAGPACQEAFGEAETKLENKDAVPTASDRLKKYLNEKRTKGGEIMSEFVPLDETSFTIIAYPVPSIGDNFEDVFRETVKVNTLDNNKYKVIQQNIIDVLDKGSYVTVTGAGANETELRITLHELTDPEKQTNFENCTADVNIPVGEVFTSPVLKGTAGLLHVSEVYLEGNFFKNLRIRFEDGMITEYSCENFATEEENRNYILENILHHHDTLPMGEFAIGTNTTAYAMGIRQGIQRQLPILIAEKTGPHFAVGDTCYSHSEDHAVYNPDGKEIIARDNEVSILRKTDRSKAYLNCHTDITIPYNELDRITVHTVSGEALPVIEKGRFVVQGTEELNIPLDEMEQ